MTKPRIDLAPFLPADGSFPYPDWGCLGDAIAAGVPAVDHQTAWTDAGRQWLRAAAAQIPGYAVHETKHFLLLLPAESAFSPVLTADAEFCRQTIHQLLPGVARFEPPGKQVVLVFPDLDWYYSYTAAFYPDRGEFGGSGGTFMRSSGYPHIVLYLSTTGHHLTPTLAHEMTHEALSHLALPLWLEEGATQCIEQEVTPGGGFGLTTEKVREQQWYWRKHGLGAFWWGQGYHRPGRVQRLCYDLSNVFFHLLSDEFRPSWFGLVGRERRENLLTFFLEANADDAGVGAAERHLGMDLGALAEKFLGPGDWAPKEADRDIPVAKDEPADEDGEEVNAE